LSLTQELGKKGRYAKVSVIFESLSGDDCKTWYAKVSNSEIRIFCVGQTRGERLTTPTMKNEVLRQKDHS